MKIQKMIVEKLFGEYNYEINVETKRYVTLIHAPNGMGKTTILRLIQAVMCGDILYLDETPFKSVKLQFSNKEYIKVEKKQIFESIFSKDFLEIRNNMSHSGENLMEIPMSISVKKMGEKVFKQNISLNRDALLMLYRRMPPRYREVGEDNVRTFKDMLVRYEISNVDLFGNVMLFEMLSDFKKRINIHFIEANRVYKSGVIDSERGRERVTNVDSIRIYAGELKEQIDLIKKEKEKISEELDRTFPNRVLKLFMHNEKKENYKEEVIKERLIELENKRIALEKIGLINENDSADLSIEMAFPKETLPVLDLYVSDNRKKLEVYNELKIKMELLLEIINNRNGFSNKKMNFDLEEGVKFVLDNGMKVPLEKLSSGEKNDFILFYELIFSCKKNELILIDEPEISLHIAWQQNFVNELLEICRINNLQAIVATHSPNIVDEHWDLLQDIVEEERNEK